MYIYVYIYTFIYINVWLVFDYYENKITGKENEKKITSEENRGSDEEVWRFWAEKIYATLDQWRVIKRRIWLRKNVNKPCVKKNSVQEETCLVTREASRDNTVEGIEIMWSLGKQVQKKMPTLQQLLPNEPQTHGIDWTLSVVPWSFFLNWCAELIDQLRSSQDVF